MSVVTSSAARHRAVARQWIDAFNARDDAGEAAARTSDYIAHAPDSMRFPALDDAAWRAFLGAFLEGFPDLRLEVEDTVADDHMTAQRILFTGTHTGTFRGLPPSGRRVRFSGIEINRMDDERVAEHWFQLDASTLFEQLGLRVVPGPRLLARLLAGRLKGLVGKRPRGASPQAVPAATSSSHGPSNPSAVS